MTSAELALGRCGSRSGCPTYERRGPIPTGLGVGQAQKLALARGPQDPTPGSGALALRCARPGTVWLQAVAARLDSCCFHARGRVHPSWAHCASTLAGRGRFASSGSAGQSQEALPILVCPPEASWPQTFFLSLGAPTAVLVEWQRELAHGMVPKYQPASALGSTVVMTTPVVGPLLPNRRARPRRRGRRVRSGATGPRPSVNPIRAQL